MQNVEQSTWPSTTAHPGLDPDLFQEDFCESRGFIDAKEGRLAYAVLSFGGFMGMGNKLFAMPWSAFEFSCFENKLILDVDKEKLKAAPAFDQDAKWPDFADRTWGDSIYKYYGHDPYWKRGIDDSGTR